MLFCVCYDYWLLITNFIDIFDLKTARSKIAIKLTAQQSQSKKKIKEAAIPFNKLIEVVTQLNIDLNDSQKSRFRYIFTKWQVLFTMFISFAK